MSQQLFESVCDFLNNDKNSSEFSDSFIHHWKNERDNGLLSLDDPEISEILSSIFCLSDLFNATEDREEYELSASDFRKEILKLFEKKNTKSI